MSRPCRVCGAPMGKWVETCPSCGEFNKVKLPFYGWVIGGMLILLIGGGDGGGQDHPPAAPGRRVFELTYTPAKVVRCVKMQAFYLH